MRQLSILEGYTPSDFGLDKWERYRTDPVSGREVQLEVIEFLAYSDKRFRAGCVPTGFGKSLIALTLAKLTNYRTAILTSTLGLEKQYVDEGSAYGLVNVRGKSNYTCAAFPNPQRPDVEADCRDGAHMGCPFIKGKGCEYERAKQAARNADLVVTNYAYWLNVNDKAAGLERTEREAEVEGDNPFDLLILDEAGRAADILSSYLSTRVYEKEIERYTDAEKFGDDIEEWKALASTALPELKKELLTTTQEIMLLGSRAKREHIEVRHRLERTVEKFSRISQLEPGEWVLEKQIGTRIGRVWHFDVIWPGRYAEQYLFCGIPNVVLMSPTTKPKMLGLLGVKSENADFEEWKRIFPINRCPVYYIPARNDSGAALRITQKSKPDELAAWVRHMDSLIDQRLDRRILLITSSYRYQQFFMEHSKHSSYLYGNKAEPEDDETATAVFEKFIKTHPPAVLVSPSFFDGWNFEYDRAEFLILSKVPLRVPGGASKIMAARLTRDKEYGDNETMQDVVQGIGRLQRHDDDRGEAVIVDGTWEWFGWKNKHLAPIDFVKNVRRVVDLPDAPEKL